MSDDLFLSTNHDGKWTVINMNINPSKIRNGINGGIDHKQIYLFISENKNIFQLNPTFEKKLAGNRDFLRTIAFDTNKHQQQHMQWEHHMDHYCCCYWPRSIHLIMDFIPATYADWLQKGITPSANDQMNLIVWVERANKWGSSYMQLCTQTHIYVFALVNKVVREYTLRLNEMNN